MNSVKERLVNGIVNAGIYRSCGIFCNNGTVFAGGIRSKSVRIAWSIYPAYCSKLYYPWTSRKLCIQESGAAIYL